MQSIPQNYYPQSILLNSPITLDTVNTLSPPQPSQPPNSPLASTYKINTNFSLPCPNTSKNQKLTSRCFALSIFRVNTSRHCPTEVEKERYEVCKVKKSQYERTEWLNQFPLKPRLESYWIIQDVKCVRSEPKEIMRKHLDPSSDEGKITRKKSSLASSSAEGVSLLIGLQFGSRALTFVVNQVLLRYLSPELLGISTQLEVYSILVLSLARESLRVAIQREADVEDDSGSKDDKEVKDSHVQSRTAAERTQAIVNLSYISIALGVVFAVILAATYTSARSENSAVLETPNFDLSLKLYGFSAFLELLSEPGFVVVQQKSRFKIRAGAESLATVLRCFVTCGSAIWASRNREDLGVLPFALGQVVYSVTLPIVYCWTVWDMAALGGFSLRLTSIHSKYSSLPHHQK